MDPAWDEKAVFLAASELKPEEREAYLSRACPDEAARERVRLLLKFHEGATLTPPALTVEAGTIADPVKIDEFVIQRRLGAGGMGVVYLADDTILGRRAAVKVLASNLAASETYVAKFREEARHAARLNHPGIVSVYKFGCDGERHYFASEFVDGPTLAAVIDHEHTRRSGLCEAASIQAWHRRCAQIVALVAEALEYSHRQGVLHRDIKPTNILLATDDTSPGSERPCVIDFGIAKQLTGLITSQPTDVMGSCHYMSPEQATAAQSKIDRRSDVFSLGVVLYEMLALRRPFEGATTHQVLRAVVDESPVRLRTIDPRIPRDLETICLKAIEKDRAERYQSAAHLAADLRSFLDGDPILARPPGVTRRAIRWTRRHRTAMAVVTCAALAVALAVALRYEQHSRRKALAWLDVTADEASSVVTIQRVNARSLEVDDAPLARATLPHETWYVPRGQYRVTVRGEDGSWFAEFNVVLTEIGLTHRTSLEVATAWREEPRGGDDPSSEADLPVNEERPRRSRARRVPTADVVVDDEMVLIADGEYPYGWTDPGTNGEGELLTERRTVQLPAFYIDRFEVSNREYQDFVTATGHAPPGHWFNGVCDDAIGSLPVVHISMGDAEAYARWRGKRLPSALEWQAATRTMKGYMFPWGSDPAPLEGLPRPSPEDLADRRSQDGGVLWALYQRRTRPVRVGDPDTSGLLHTLDNIAELSGSLAYEQHDSVIHGWYFDVKPTEWHLASVSTAPRAQRHYEVGFRCAKSAHPPPLK